MNDLTFFHIQPACCCILSDTSTSTERTNLQYFDSKPLSNDTACSFVVDPTDDNLNDKGQWVKDAVPLLTLLMLLIMVVQLFIQMRDSRKSSKNYKEHMDKQKENVGIIVESVQKNGLIKSVIYKNNLIKAFDDLCHYLTNDMSVAQDIEQDYIRRTTTSIDILYNLMKYYKIGDEAIYLKIQSFKDDLLKLKNNECPHTIRGMQKWVAGFMEKNSPIIQEVCELFNEDNIPQ